MQAPTPGSRARVAARTLAALAAPVLVVAVTVLTVAVERSTSPERLADFSAGNGVLGGLTGLAMAVAGAVLVARGPVVGARGSVRIGVVMAVFGVLWGLDGFWSAWAAYASEQTPRLPGASAGLWMVSRFDAFLMLPLALLPAIYPTGSFPVGRWRRRSLLGVALVAYIPVVLLVAPGRIVHGGPDGAVPAAYRGLQLDGVSLPMPDGLAIALLIPGIPLTVLGLAISAAVVFARHRAVRGVDRLRLRWLLWAALADVIALVLGLLAGGGDAVSVALFVAVALTSASIVVGVLAPTLLDVDRLLGGTFVYGVLALAVVALDAAVVGLAGALLGDRITERGVLVVVLLVAALLYMPARQGLWRLARRMLFGRRDDPYGVVAGLAARLETGSEEAQLEAVAAAVAEAFRVPFVAVEVDRAAGDRVVARHGAEPDEVDVLPISYRGEVVGRLLLPRRGLRVRLSARDERLLADVVRQAAVAARSSQLAAQLQAGREALVTSREEERRRLRRDLHDGLGPALAAVVLRIDTARNQAASDPGAADATLRQARAELAGVVSDVRRLVHDLRPPALDDVGVVGALEQQAVKLAPPSLSVAVEAGELGRLPAAVEVAAYRIASEAMMNVVKHARATTCTVRLEREEGGLMVHVQDDGGGIAPDRTSGVGLLSVRERAAELGGRCEITCPPAGGTVVRAWLPA